VARGRRGKGRISETGASRKRQCSGLGGGPAFCLSVPESFPEPPMSLSRACPGASPCLPRAFVSRSHKLCRAPLSLRPSRVLLAAPFRASAPRSRFPPRVAPALRSRLPLPFARPQCPPLHRAPSLPRLAELRPFPQRTQKSGRARHRVFPVIPQSSASQFSKLKVKVEVLREAGRGSLPRPERGCRGRSPCPAWSPGPCPR